MFTGGGEERADNSRVDHSSQKGRALLLFLLSGWVTALIPQALFFCRSSEFLCIWLSQTLLQRSIFDIENSGQEFHKDCVGLSLVPDRDGTLCFFGHTGALTPDNSSF